MDTMTIIFEDTSSLKRVDERLVTRMGLWGPVIGNGFSLLSLSLVFFRHVSMRLKKFVEIIRSIDI